MHHVTKLRTSVFAAAVLSFNGCSTETPASQPSRPDTLAASATPVPDASQAELTCNEVTSLNYEIADSGGDPDPESAARGGAGRLVDLQPEDAIEDLGGGEGTTRRYGVSRDGDLIATVVVVQTMDDGWLVSDVSACQQS